jgi:hypothetical protein
MDANKYIKSILPDNWQMTNLYVYMDLASNEILSTYGSPTDIVRHMWQKTLYYEIDTGNTYNNTGAYLIEQCKQQNYPTCNYMLDNVLVNNTLTDADLRELSFIFLHAHSAYHPAIMFGYIKPEQKFMLVDAFKTTNIAYPNFTADIVISRTGYGKVRQFRPI